MQYGPNDLGEFVRRVREAYRVRQGARLLPSHDRALQDLGDCRTGAMGGHRYGCEACGERFWVYHACGNRSCPACHGRQMREWLDQRRAQLLPCGYFHVVATVPSAIRRAFLAHQKAMYDLLMKVVSESVIDLCRQERFLGATPGILMVLHTWSAQLHYHPHVHLLVTAGGIIDDGEHWRELKHKDFLLPVKALSKLLRRRFGEALHRLRPEVFKALPPETWTHGWNTFCKGYGEGAEAVLTYLARYVFRVALTNARLVSTQGGHVTFRWKDRATSQWRLCRLDEMTFLDRFLMHVLPKGFHKVRYYGLWHPSKKAQQQALRLQGARADPAPLPPVETAPRAPKADALAAPRDPASRETTFAPTCPRCGGAQLIHLEELRRSVFAPCTRAGP